MFIPFNISSLFSKKKKMPTHNKINNKKFFSINIHSRNYIETQKIYLKKFFLKYILFFSTFSISNFAYSQSSIINTIQKGVYTKNGLKSITYVKGSGLKPEWGNFVKINYVIYLVKNSNIEKIDSTYERQTSFIFRHGSGQVIMGIEEAIHNMNEGAKKRIIIPDNLGYITPNLGPIPPSTLKREKILKKNKSQNLKENIFLLVDIELVNILGGI
nr:fkbp-like protein [Cryptomonas curvata]